MYIMLLWVCNFAALHKIWQKKKLAKEATQTLLPYTSWILSVKLQCIQLQSIFSCISFWSFLIKS